MTYRESVAKDKLVQFCIFVSTTVGKHSISKYGDILLYGEQANSLETLKTRNIR